MFIIVFVLLLLYLLLLLLPPLPLIKGAGIACKINQPVFVCYVSTSMKIILSTELIL